MAVQQGHQKETYDADVKGQPCCVNDLVFLHNPAVRKGFSDKLHRPWQGPFKVLKVLGPSIYRIVDNGHLDPTTILEEPIRDPVEQLPEVEQLDHAMPKMECPADAHRAPPPAAENDAPALRRSLGQAGPQYVMEIQLSYQTLWMI